MWIFPLLYGIIFDMENKISDNRTKTLNKIFDDGTKTLKWWNRNYFFIATIFIALVNIILYAAGGSNWETQFNPGFTAWSEFFNLSLIWRQFLNNFSHANWQHCLLNMLCFVICGSWLERRKGSFALVGLVLLMSLVGSAFVTSVNGSYQWHGFSGVNYALYAYAIIDYIFLFRKETRSRENVISGAILMGLIYFAACFDGGVTQVSFRIYPYDFLHNVGHYASFVAGLIIAIVIQVVKIFSILEKKSS